jgi:hypothetical protein
MMTRMVRLRAGIDIVDEVEKCNKLLTGRSGTVIPTTNAMTMRVMPPMIRKLWRFGMRRNRDGVVTQQGRQLPSV